MGGPEKIGGGVGSYNDTGIVSTKNGAVALKMGEKVGSVDITILV